MESINNSAYSDLIYRFMDGDANGAQQKVLFDKIASDAGLQSEFQEAVAIVKGFNADKSFLAPSAQLTNKLFKNAGFVSPMSSLSNNGTGFLRKFNGRSSPIISMATGALITALMFLAFNNNKNIQTPDKNSIIASANISQDANIKTLIPVMKSEAKSAIYENKSNKLSDEYNSENITASKPGSVNSEHRLTQTQPTYVNTSLNKAYEIPINHLNNLSGEITNTELNLMNLEVELRGMTGLAFFPTRTIEPEPFSVLNNLGAAVKYKFNDNHSAGLIIGNESLQMYTYSVEGDDFIFNLEPYLFWAGVTYRYHGDEIYGSFRPYGEMILAGSKYGPIGKTAFGISYNPEDIFSMSLGLEGSSLIYNYLGESKHTEKLSVVYNIAFHF